MMSQLANKFRLTVRKPLIYTTGLAIAVAAVVLAGCGTFSKSREQNLYQVHLGQSKADLVGALGEPVKQVHEGGGTEKWLYEVYSTDNRQIYPYTATFENDKLAHWDFDTNRAPDMPRSVYLRGPASTSTADRPFSY